MLRRTLRWLLDKELPFTPKRPVMAKARSIHNSNNHNTNSSSSSNSNNINNSTTLSHAKLNGFVNVHQNDLEGDLNHHSSSIDEDVDSHVTETSPTSTAIVPASGIQHRSKDMHSDASEDAFRFLLHHIDSEIAALKRRVVAVGKQREIVEDTQTRRIRDLFNCIERPWLLLESIPAPQLPNKAFDVYAKEQYIRTHHRDGDSNSNSNNNNNNNSHNADFEQDAVFLNACRRNWKSLPITHRKPYEIAARRNEHTRKELKKRISNGCSFFESFCEELKEWTAEMAREDIKGKSPARQRTTASRNIKTIAGGNAVKTAVISSIKTPLTSPVVMGKGSETMNTKQRAKKRGAAPGKGKAKKTAQRTGTARKETAVMTNMHATTKSSAKQKPQQRRKLQSSLPKAKLNRVHRVKKSNATPKAMAAKRKKKK